ncbi:MAG: peptidyl-prolyl cis-trans isomerase [Puniceicoccales bacterium]|nr:peptidyl-prolyl cis-trans isomerase [Puniceicoccales bacterium]
MFSMLPIGAGAESSDGGEVPVDGNLKLPQTFEEPAYYNGIAAIVNNQIITMERVRLDAAPMLQQIQAESSSQEDFYRRLHAVEFEVLNGIINRKLIVDAFFERGGRFSEAYEKKEYENYLKNVFGGKRLELSKFLREYGKSVREFKKDVKERAIVGFMARELQASQTEVSPAKVKEYYDSHMSEFFYAGEIDLKQIVLNDNGEGRAKLQAVYGELSNGSEFYEVAKKYSDNLGIYSIGYVSRGDLKSEIAQAIENIGAGEYSREVALDDTLCIFFVAVERPAKQLTLEEVSQGIENKLFLQYRDEARIRWLQKLRDGAYIKIYMEQPAEEEETNSGE